LNSAELYEFPQRNHVMYFEKVNIFRVQATKAQ